MIDCPSSSLDDKLPLVTVLIPCRNEEKYIVSCLESVINQDYAKNALEVLVLDGMSTDRTRDIISEYPDRGIPVRVIDNPQKIVPTALNIGIKHANGSVILRMDAHNNYEPNYISLCIKHLITSGVDNVGGVWVIVPGSGTASSLAIARALAHPFAAGNAHYRIGANEPRLVDTVPFGCYRRDVFDRIGLFDEELVRNQDDEFNARLIKNNGKILLVPDIISYYHARESYGKLAKMNFQYGYFKPLVGLKLGKVMTIRQIVPATFIMVLLTTLVIGAVSKLSALLFVLLVISYLLISIAVSIPFAIRENPLLAFGLPAAFATIHFSYGFGYLKGVVDFLLLKKRKLPVLGSIEPTR